MSKYQFNKEQREKILHGSMIEGIKVFRDITYFGLVDSKNAVEAIRAGRLPIEEFFEAKERCPHCDGTGFVKPPDKEQPNVV